MNTPPDPEAGKIPPASDTSNAVPLTDPSAPPSVPPMPPPPVYPEVAELSKGSRWTRLILALILPNALALALMGLTKVLLNLQNTGVTNSQSGIYIVADFVIIPLLMGITAAFCIRDLRLSVWWHLLIALINTILSIGLSYLVLQEGYLCLIIVSPLLLAFIALGGLLGRLMFRPRYRVLRISLAPVACTLLVVDALSPHHYHNTVTDVVTVNAPPERVWQFVADYPAIDNAPDYWLFKIGLPAPMQSVTNGHYVGAERRCAFKGGFTLGEKIVEYEPNRKLTFEVTDQPNNPEITGHINADRGQFILKDNGDGTTTVIGTSWYRLHVYPTAYYDLWAQDIIRHVHLRVMNHIKTLAENPAQPPLRQDDPR